MCREEEITKNLNLNEQKLKELYNKQGRGVQFQNKVSLLYIIYVVNLILL